MGDGETHVSAGRAVEPSRVRLEPGKGWGRVGQRAEDRRLSGPRGDERVHARGSAASERPIHSRLYRVLSRCGFKKSLKFASASLVVDAFRLFLVKQLNNFSSRELRIAAMGLAQGPGHRASQRT